MCWCLGGPLGVGVESGFEPPAGNLSPFKSLFWTTELSLALPFYLNSFAYFVCVYGEHGVPQQECGGHRTLAEHGSLLSPRGSLD